MKKLNLILLVLFATISLNLTGLAQEKEAIDKRLNKPDVQPAGEVFNEIQSGILSGKVSSFSHLFSSQMFLNLSNGISGYYSSNQAYYVIQDFFKQQKPLTFEISDIQQEGDNTYATGTYNYLSKGKEQTNQVYLSLKQSGKKWKITQITIN